MSDAQIFQLMGIVYLAVGVGILLNYSHYKKMIEDFVNDTTALYLGGIMALVVGYLLVNYHNIWVKDWHVIITVIGWAALIKGLFILILPKSMILLTKAFLKLKSIMIVETVFIIIVGLLFMYLGYCPKSPL
jgi:hypothetical protein